jgi:hypothetical protein
MINWCNQQSETIQFTFTLVFYFSFFSSIRSCSYCHNPLGCHGSCLFFGQTSLDRGRKPSLSVGDAPDCRWNQWNRTLRFVKLDNPVFLIWTGASSSLFNSCAYKSISVCQSPGAYPLVNDPSSPPKGRHEWIRHKEYLQVHCPWMKRRMQDTTYQWLSGPARGLG